MKNNKVVYRHRNAETFQVFYIGIGNKRRPYKRGSRNTDWHETVNKCGYIVEVIANNLSWEDACELEILLIKEYGRRDLGLGPLVNWTDGGGGVVNWSDAAREKARHQNLGKKLSEETKAKFSTYQKCRKHSAEQVRNRSLALTGKKRTEEQKIKMSIATKGKTLSIATKEKMKISNKGKRSKKVIDTTTMIVYASIGEASEALNISYSRLNRYLSGTRRPKTGVIITLKYLEI